MNQDFTIDYGNKAVSQIANPVNFKNNSDERN